MSIFNEYARKLDEMARISFEEYQGAEADYKKAEARAKEYPMRYGVVDAKYMTKSARAQADFLEAKEAYTKARNNFRGSGVQFVELRNELVNAIRDEFRADPAAIDEKTIELLKSGILKGDEYIKLVEEAETANNPTMVRMIGKYAAEKANERIERYGRSDTDARYMRMAEHKSRSFTGENRIEDFDNMISLYNRCVNNPTLISFWNEWTGNAIENF